MRRCLSLWRQCHRLRLISLYGKNHSMADSRRIGELGTDPIRTDPSGVGRSSVRGRQGDIASPPGRQRIPTMRQLAALVVNGILTLPRNYRRGMYLDIIV